MTFVPPAPRKRLDTYLASLYPDISRAFLQKLCNTEQVLVNDKPEKSGFKLKPDDKVKVLYDISAIEKIDNIELPILYQDDNVIVINKPAGVISHARGKYWNEPSVASFIRQHTRLSFRRDGQANQAGERAGIVHRLDRATSGVMICAKNQETFSHLQKQFADRKVKKVYVAVVLGRLSPPEAIIDMPIERNPKMPSTFRVGVNGKISQTHYKVMESSKNYDLVQLEPATGRTHQLRVHMQHQGHPIIGDTFYEGETSDRLYLHAFELTINLPGDIPRTFQAPLPNEFKQILSDDHE